MLFIVCARTVLAVAVAAMQFYMRTTDVSAQMEEMKLEGKTVPDSAGAGPVTVKQLFKDPELRKPLFIACALAVIQQFSGINAVRMMDWRRGPVAGGDSPSQNCTMSENFLFGKFKKKYSMWGLKFLDFRPFGDLGAKKMKSWASTHNFLCRKFAAVHRKITTFCRPPNVLTYEAAGLLCCTITPAVRLCYPRGLSPRAICIYHLPTCGCKTCGAKLFVRMQTLASLSHLVYYTVSVSIITMIKIIVLSSSELSTCIAIGLMGWTLNMVLKWEPREPRDDSRFDNLTTAEQADHLLTHFRDVNRRQLSQHIL